MLFKRLTAIYLLFLMISGCTSAYTVKDSGVYTRCTEQYTKCTINKTVWRNECAMRGPNGKCLTYSQKPYQECEYSRTVHDPSCINSSKKVHDNIQQLCKSEPYVKYQFESSKGTLACQK